MQEIIPLVVGILIPIIALLAEIVVKYSLRNKSKEVIAKNHEGKLEYISVRAIAKDYEISEEVKKVFEYEQYIFGLLKEIEGKTKSMHAHPGKSIDFIVTYPGHKMAIEVKNSLDRLSRDQVQRYLTADEGLDKLLLVSRKPASQKTVGIVRDLLESGKVSFLPVANAQSGARELERAVKQGLQIADV